MSPMSLGSSSPTGLTNAIRASTSPIKKAGSSVRSSRTVGAFILCSYEDVDRTKVRSGKVVTHDWIYHLQTGQLQSALEKNRQADQLRPYCLLAGDQRVIETAIIGTEERIFIKDLDGGNAIELTNAGGGFHYARTEPRFHTPRLPCHRRSSQLLQHGSLFDQCL